jgi:hypothetical protein
MNKSLTLNNIKLGKDLQTTTPPSSTTTTTNSSWLLRFFESKHFDMSIAISYLFNSKEPGVQTYLCNRLFTFPESDVDFYLPQLLNIYIYCCNDNNEFLLADMLYSYFRTRCSCRQTGIDFSLRCSWLLDAHINDNAKLAKATINYTKESRVKRGLNNAIKLYKLIISERLRPAPSSPHQPCQLNGLKHNNNSNNGSSKTTNSNIEIITNLVKEEYLVNENLTVNGVENNHVKNDSHIG